jgi:hypothetical protein
VGKITVSEDLGDSDFEITLEQCYVVRSKQAPTYIAGIYDITRKEECIANFKRFHLKEDE